MLRNSQTVSFYPLGLSDAADQVSAFPGACNSLQNTVFDRQNRGAVISRPGVVDQTNKFAGFTTPGQISCMLAVGSRIYGLVATGRNANSDEPFCWDTSTNSFVTISGVLSSNVPATPATTGAWTPPTMDMVGTKIIVTHPGFSGSNFFGWFDVGGFTASITGNTNSNNQITNLSSTAGLINGMGVSGAGIPAGTVIVSISGTTATISQNATATATGVALTITGGSQTSPAWGAGNTATNALPTKPLWVVQFFNRAYFGIGNAVYFTDSLNALNISNTNFAGVLTLGDSSSTTGASGLAFSTSSAGILSSICVFKANSIWQISGDITGTGSTALSLNIISLNVGSTFPRSAVSTPRGVYFIGTDGPRIIDLRGQLQYMRASDSATPDVVLPFSNATTPSRVCAAYTNSIYRVCADTIVNNQTLTGADYWFDHIFVRWNGPHTFAYSAAVSVGGSFYLASPTLVGLFKSDVLQSASTVYNDNGSAFSSTVKSTSILIPSDMNEVAVIESTMELGSQQYSSVFDITATDAQNKTLNEVVMSFLNNPPLYGTAIYGTSIYTTYVLTSRVVTIPWTKPLVCKKLSFSVLSAPGNGFAMRESKFRFQKLGYTNA